MRWVNDALQVTSVTLCVVLLVLGGVRLRQAAQVRSLARRSAFDKAHLRWKGIDARAMVAQALTALALTVGAVVFTLLDRAR